MCERCSGTFLFFLKAGEKKREKNIFPSENFGRAHTRFPFFRLTRGKIKCKMSLTKVLGAFPFFGGTL